MFHMHHRHCTAIPLTSSSTELRCTYAQSSLVQAVASIVVPSAGSEPAVAASMEAEQEQGREDNRKRPINDVSLSEEEENQPAAAGTAEKPRVKVLPRSEEVQRKHRGSEGR